MFWSVNHMLWEIRYEDKGLFENVEGLLGLYQQQDRFFCLHWLLMIYQILCFMDRTNN